MTNWQLHESEVQETLGLSSTIASGNKFHDPSDGVSNKHHADDSYPMMVDCKATSNKGFRLSGGYLQQWWEKAVAFGKIFAMPVRFYKEDETYEDWIVLKLFDFAELLDQSRKVAEKPKPFERSQKFHDAINELYDLGLGVKDAETRSKILNLADVMDQSLPGERSL